MIVTNIGHSRSHDGLGVAVAEFRQLRRHTRRFLFELPNILKVFVYWFLIRLQRGTLSHPKIKKVRMGEKCYGEDRECLFCVWGGKKAKNHTEGLEALLAPQTFLLSSIIGYSY
jgi:hypothetical protein